MAIPEKTSAEKRLCITGIIEKIIYTSEETHFTVARLCCDESGDNIAIVGTIMATNEGERIRAWGNWEKHAKYGKQFHIDYFEVLLPTDEEAIEKYLASGIVKGVGPALAKRIVKHFGKQTLQVLAENPERLLEVTGIGKKKYQELIVSWRAHRDTQEVMMFLVQYGISGVRATKIYDYYGGNVVSILQHHPYRLAIDIDGIGFLTADRIARQAGIAADDPERIEACLLHVLNEGAAHGHCFLPQEDLVKAVSTTLQLDVDKIEPVLRKCLDQGPLQQPESEGKPVYLKFLYFCESQVARLLQDCLAAPMAHHFHQIEQNIANSEREMKIAFFPAQRQAVQEAIRQKICIITGGPGVGKTTIVKALVQILNQAKYKVALAAPTGRAAKRLSEATNAQATTIHRLLKYNPRTRKFDHNHDDPLPVDHLIIDETSMVDIVLAYHLLNALPLNTSITFVGDADQLPSVGPGNFLKDLLESQAIPVVKLSHIFRQAQGSSIVEVAHQVNAGIVPKIPTHSSDIVLVPMEEPEKGANYIVELVAQRLPHKYGFHPLTEIQVLTPMYRGQVGADHLNATLGEALNPNGAPIANGRFYEGDKVMQIVNNYDKDVYNGDIGVITSYKRQDNKVTVNFDNHTVTYQENELDELVRAYAISIHKSQGSEYPAVIIPLFTEHYIMLERNLFYTAITRGKQLVIILGSYRALGIAVRTVRARNRFTRLRLILKT